MAEAKKEGDLEAAYQDIMKDLDKIWQDTVDKEPKKETKTDPKASGS